MAMLRPTVTMLDHEETIRVIEQAWRILETVGVQIDDPSVLAFLKSSGFKTCEPKRRSYFTRLDGERLLQSVPSSFQLSGQQDSPILNIGGESVHFDPGSAAVYWLDCNSDRHRRATAADCVSLARLTEALPRFAIQATGIVPSDIPEELADCHRLATALVFCRKPIVTGTFRKESFSIMQEMLELVRGGNSTLRSSPLAVFDCCPSPPLRWSELTLSALVDCARSGIPAEIVSMPLAGATAPVTLIGSVVQHAAETLSGIMIHQLYGSGSPIVWGGSPAAFDMRHGTPPMGAIETMMIDLAYARVGKMLGIPVHAYMACSDSKAPDYQAGMETGIGATLAALAGINIVSGPGFLNYENTLSPEKLVLDHEAISQALRLIEGVNPHPESDPVEIISRRYEDSLFLSDPSTRTYHKQEIRRPDRTVTRCSMEEWSEGGGLWAHEIAASEVSRLLKSSSYRLDAGKTEGIVKILTAAATELGFGVEIKTIFDREYA